MIIEGIDLYLVENSFHTPWRTAYGADASNCVLMTRLRSGGCEGWSESSPLPGPFYSCEYGRGVFNVAQEYLAPLLIGKAFDSAQQVQDAMSAVKGNPFAKAGLEMAWWTLAAEMDGIPLHKLLSPEGAAATVPEGAGVGVCDSYDELIAQVGAALDSGAERVKLKAMHGWDLEMVRVVRTTFPDATLHIDCNASYTIEERDIFRQMDRFGLAMIEQPFSQLDILDHAKLQAELDTPICLDESIMDPLVARQALEIGACKLMNIKPARVGGLLNSIKINKLCEEANVGCWVGGMLESDVGKAICVELAASRNMVYPHDITAEADSYPEPIAERPLTHVAPWQLAVSAVPGTPIKPDMLKMRAKTLCHASL